MMNDLFDKFNFGWHSVQVIVQMQAEGITGFIAGSVGSTFLLFAHYASLAARS